MSAHSAQLLCALLLPAHLPTVCTDCPAAGATLKLRLLKKGKPLLAPAAAAGGAGVAAPAPAAADSTSKQKMRKSTASVAAADGSSTSSSSEAEQGWHVFKAESGLKEYVLW